MFDFTISQIAVNSSQIVSRVFTGPYLNVQYFGRDLDNFLKPETTVLVIRAKSGPIPSAYPDQFIESLKGKRIFSVLDKCNFFSPEQTVALDRVLKENIAKNSHVAVDTLKHFDILYNLVCDQVSHELGLLAVAGVSMLGFAYQFGYPLYDILELMALSGAVAAAIHLTVSKLHASAKDTFFQFVSEPAAIARLNDDDARSLLAGYHLQKNDRGFFARMLSNPFDNLSNVGRMVQMAHDPKIDKQLSSRSARL